MATEIFSDETFETAIVNPDMPTVVYIWATWCHPCKSQTPQFEIAAQSSEAQFFKLNADEYPGFLRRFRVLGVPSLLYFHRGKMADSHTGLQTAPQIAAQLSDISVRPIDELTEQSPAAGALRSMSLLQKVLLITGFLIAISGIIHRLL